MTICILSDENTDKVLKVLKSIHCGRGIEQDIHFFDGEKQLLLFCAAKEVHVVIISEDTGEYDGYETAYRVRMVDKNILPIIMVKQEKLDMRAGDAELFGYLTYTNMEQKLPELIEYAAKRMQPDEVHLLYYYWNGTERNVDVGSILYFWSNHRVVEYKRVDGMQGVFYQKLDVVERILQDQAADFIRIGKSFLVNQKYVMEKKGAELLLINGEKLSISRRYRKKIEI